MKERDGRGEMWSTAELTTLRAAYELGGARAARAALPHRTKNAIGAQIFVQVRKGLLARPPVPVVEPEVLPRFDSRALLYRLHDGLRKHVA